MNSLNTVVALIAASVIWLVGCSKDPSPGVGDGRGGSLDSVASLMVASPSFPTNWITLGPAQRSKLAAAVNEYALKGGNSPQPSMVQDLKPLEVYSSRVNVVIAMRREGGEELGYYIQPWISSHLAEAEPSPEWSLLPLSGADETGTVCYAYRRLLKKN